VLQEARELKSVTIQLPGGDVIRAQLAGRCAAPPAAVYYKHVADDDVRFDWDQANAEHIARHSVRPDEAEQAIRNDPLDMNYEVIDGEERWTALGHTDEYRVLLVVWTVRTDALRIVTARAVGRRAREAYLRAKGLLT
jgi:uncharacterized DUF497 family protein